MLPFCLLLLRASSRPTIAMDVVLCDYVRMSLPLEGDMAGVAVFNLGPMDGQVQPVCGETDDLCVVLTDGQQHRYSRTSELQRLPDGRSAVVFDWQGRYYGPK